MAHQKRLDGRVALITGGGRGIGRAIAMAYAAEGARLTLSARTDAELQDTANAITQRFGAEVQTVIADVTDRAQVDNAVARTLERYGVIDVMVNNAGNIGPVGRLWDNDPDDWARTISVHLLGVYYGCRAVIPAMLERGSGRIVNMSGVGGPNMTAYDVAKVSIVNLTENLALELADTPITVNAISPGSIHTRMWEETRDLAFEIGDMATYERGVQVTSGEGASIERAAELAVFLGSDACGTLSGRLIRAFADRFEDFPANVDAIMESDAYTLRRVDPANPFPTSQAYPDLPIQQP
jgi:NAD(P)-dependent dehydrogenase (short-subunit alcohol dehydrogenase family)